MAIGSVWTYLLRLNFKVAKPGFALIFIKSDSKIAWASFLNPKIFNARPELPEIKLARSESMLRMIFLAAKGKRVRTDKNPIAITKMVISTSKRVRPCRGELERK